MGKSDIIDMNQLDLGRFRSLPYSQDYCVTCALCSSACPVAGIDEFDPRKVIRMVSLGQEGALGAVHPEIELVGNLGFTGLGAGAAGGAVLIDVARGDAHGDIVAAGSAADLFDFGEGQHLDPGVVFDSSEIDLKPAGGGA